MAIQLVSKERLLKGLAKVGLAMLAAPFLQGGCFSGGDGAGVTNIWFQSNRDGDYEIYRMDANGSNVTQLTANSVFDIDPAVSPGGSKIAFVRDVPTGGASPSGGPTLEDGTYSPDGKVTEIFIMDANGTNVTQLTSNGVFNGQPSFSPNAQEIVWNRSSEIWKMDADGSNPTQLTSGFSDHDPSYSPDGSKIAFVRNSDIYVMDADGNNVTQLTNTDNNDHPSWSPSGTKIVFERNLGNNEIYVMNANGSNKTQITSNGDNNFDPVYTPDGRMIVWERIAPGDDNDIWIMRADGSNPMNLTNDASNRDEYPAVRGLP
ncbi:MAG: PD40 domain-containing protein [Armatimonadetes bacterium]|nr:PD40 domain-containing protein [Armatimonadota bacterium]